MILTTVCSKAENFIYYLRVMVHSLKVSGFDRRTTPLYVFTDGLLKKDETFLKKLWNVKFIKVDKAKYKKLDKDNPKFWALETYNPVHYKKKEDVLFLDADLLIIKDITGIKKFMKSGITMWRERGRACFNSGVVCINKSKITKKIYTDLINYPINKKEFGHDQQALNNYFHPTINELPKFYNMFVGWRDEEKDISNVGIVHYIHKPDRQKTHQLINPVYMRLWNDYYQGMLNEQN
jgi:lipopolysaccharide biosynthesis glycosyltransferase